MKEGDLIKFRYKDKIRYGYVIGNYDLLFIVKGFKPKKQYLLSRKEIINKIGGLERWNKKKNI